MCTESCASGARRDRHMEQLPRRKCDRVGQRWEVDQAQWGREIKQRLILLWGREELKEVTVKLGWEAHISQS